MLAAQPAIRERNVARYQQELTLSLAVGSADDASEDDGAPSNIVSANESSCDVSDATKMAYDTRSVMLDSF